MEAELIGERLATAIASQGSADPSYNVSVTVGTSTLDPMLSLRDAIERADAELYARKKRARQAQRSTASNVVAASERD
jgi:outer membrane protein TolC